MIEELKLSNIKNYFRIEKYPYRVLEVQLNNRMKDKQYVDISNIIHSLLLDLKDRIVFNKNGIVYRKSQPISFEILYGDKNISFNFAINELDSLYFKNKLQTILPNSTLIFKDDYINDFVGSKLYKYNYSKHYMCSIDIDKSPMDGLLAIKKDINKEEKVLLQTIINPIHDMWKDNALENWNKVKKGKDITNNGFLMNCFEFINSFIEGALGIVDDIFDVKTKQPESSKSKRFYNEFSSSSRLKTNYDGFKVNINTYVKSDNQLQCHNISRSIETCYKEVEGDNGITMNKKYILATNKSIDRNGNVIRNLLNKNIMNSNEIATLLKLPDGIIQRKLGLQSIKYNQVDIPKVMRKGDVKLGSVTFHGEEMGIYLPTDINISCLPLILLTKMGGGKTSELLNIANDTIKAHQSLVLFDYIRDLQLSNSLIDLYDKDVKVFKLDYNDNNLPSFAFHEVEILETDTPFTKKVKAGIIATEIKYMLNSMAKDTTDMSRIMSKYLNAACKVVFTQPNQTLSDLLNVLEDKNIRERYIIKAINSGVLNADSREITVLKDLDNPAKVEGLLDRFSVITENTLFSAMLEKSYNDNVNFAQIMDTCKPIVIQLPQDIFTNKLDKDTICTYFMSRIRLAMSVRKNYDKVCRVIMDEPHQIPKTIDLMGDTIAEPRKFGIQYIMGLHSLNQLPNKVREVIVEVGCNFMLLKGVSNKSFEELRDYIDEEIVYEDIVNMDYDFGALFLFTINNKYESFIGRLREPLKDKKGKLCIGNK